jgi:hypothetical protein
VWMRDNMQGAVKALLLINERELPAVRSSSQIGTYQPRIERHEARRPNQTPHPSAFLCATQCGRVSVAGQHGVPM